MATNKSILLYINNGNVTQYFTTNGGALNGAAVMGKYITMRSSSTTSTFTLNDAGHDALFPSADAKANKLDVWAQAIAGSANRCTLSVALAGTDVIAADSIGTSLGEHTGSVSGSFAKSAATAVYTVHIPNLFHAAGVRDTSITAWFWQYACAANAVGNGVKSVSVSSAEPYEGETVTFTADLFSGASWDGWYSDAACTNLVSTQKEYSVVPNADLTLYAKSTSPDGNIYKCSAIAKDNIASVSVSEPDMVEGGTCVFTAAVNLGSKFLGWYSDEACTQLVSENASYTAIISSNTTLYAKGEKIIYHAEVGEVEHCTASVSAATVYYGEQVTFNCIPNEDYEFKGWYSDETYNQLASNSASYSYTVTDNIILWPKVEIITYKVTFQASKSSFGATQVELRIIAVDFDSLSSQEQKYLKTGDYSLISQEKIYDQATDSGNQTLRTVTASVNVPKGKYAAMYAPEGTTALLGSYSTVMFFIEDRTGEETKRITNWPYYWYQPTQDMAFDSNTSSFRCKCIAIAKEGIVDVDATSPVSSTKDPKAMGDGKTYTAIFSAKTSPRYEFSGWYSDEECATLVSADNPAYIITPEADGKTESIYTLYAKATKVSSDTGFYLKKNGAFVEATIVYKKIDGVWTQQTELRSLFSGSASGNESNYIYCGEV